MLRFCKRKGHVNVLLGQKDNIPSRLIRNLALKLFCYLQKRKKPQENGQKLANIVYQNHQELVGKAFEVEFTIK